MHHQQHFLGAGSEAATALGRLLAASRQGKRKYAVFQGLLTKTPTEHSQEDGQIHGLLVVRVVGGQVLLHALRELADVCDLNEHKMETNSGGSKSKSIACTLHQCTPSTPNPTVSHDQNNHVQGQEVLQAVHNTYCFKADAYILMKYSAHSAHKPHHSCALMGSCPRLQICPCSPRRTACGPAAGEWSRCVLILNIFSVFLSRPCRCVEGKEETTEVHMNLASAKARLRRPDHTHQWPWPQSIKSAESAEAMQ